MTLGTVASTGLIGVGYEGQTIATFVDALTADGVTHLVDVRLNPISRKPGFSKTALTCALAAAGIAYEHRPELGNPKPNRAGFGGDHDQLTDARRVYAEWINRPAAGEALDALADLSQRARVAVLCFEADQGRCHRDIVLDRARSRAAQRRG